ncbi:MAG: DUF4238 domain-containing protein [Litorimonas sp.]
MSNPKRHHHVPQFLLNEIKGDGQLFYFDKSKSTKIIEPRNPVTIFRRNHLYSYVDQQGQKITDTEGVYLSDLDSRASQVVEKMIERIRSRVAPNLSAAEKEIWDRFYSTQFQRSYEKMTSPKKHRYFIQTFR